MRIYFSSGVIERHTYALKKCKVKNGLFSYLFILKRPECFSETDFKSVMVDSGAYTFLANPKEMEKKFKTRNSKRALYKFVEEYVQWLYDNTDKYEYAVEVDLYDAFGEDFIFRLHEEFFKPFQRDTGKEVIFVMQERGLSDWNKLIKDPEIKFLGIGSTNSLSVKNYVYWVSKCIKYNKKVHGFAITNLKYLLRIPFYSVDSTTWMSSDKYGEHFFFDKKNMKIRRIYSRKPELLIKYYPQMAEDYSLQELKVKYKNDARLCFAIKQFQEVEDFCTDMWKRKGIDYD